MMFKKTITVFVFLASIVNNTVFSQAVEYDITISNDAMEVSESEPDRSEDEYSIGERLGMSALNIFGGAGSISRGNRTGWLVTGIQGIGLLSILGGVIYGVVGVPSSPPELPSDNLVNNEYLEAKERYDYLTGVRRGLITAGAVTIGTGVVVGLVIPFFHQRSDNTGSNFADGNFPFNLELVSSNGQNVNGFNISYKMIF